MEFGILALLMVGAFGSMVVLVVLAVVVAHRRAAKRREDFAGLAAYRGWTYAQRDDRWASRFTGSPFDQGHNRQAGNVVVGQFQGRGFAAFDYTYYTTQSGTDANGNHQSREVRHDHSVVALNTGAAFPPMAVAPEGTFGRLVGRLTGQDIELESEDFNRAFTVTCPSRRFASDVLHPRMMELLLTQPHFAFRFDGPSILTIRTGHAAIPEVEARLALLDAIVLRIPDVVWRTVRGG